AACSQAPDAVTPGDEDEASLHSGSLAAINFYRAGRIATLELDGSMAAFFVNALDATLKAAPEAGQFVADDSGLSAKELMDAYTCLELVYVQPITVPLRVDDAYPQAQRLLYAVNAGADGASIVYLGGADYAAASLGAITDSSIATLIGAYVQDELEKAEFSEDGEVQVAGVTMQYLAEQSADIDEPLLSQLLFTAVTFYDNCYHRNFDANQFLITEGLRAALDRAANNEQTDNSHGEEILLQLDDYFDYAAPITAQVVYDGHYGDYIVYLTIDAVNTLEIVFLDLDGYPYVEACRLISV
ncbi:MAG: hypothetical protein GX572_05630, partial [Clostridia bacterium]|nr:hypothetical protein [Clostridia bacterium]